MPRIGNVGRRIAKGMGTRNTMLAAGAGGILGMAASNPIEQTQAAMDEVLLGTDQADVALVGREVGLGSFVNPMGNPATAIPRAAGMGAILGGLIGAGSGSSVGSRVAYGALGMLGGGAVGGIAGAGATIPYINGTTLADAFREDKSQNAYEAAALANAEAGFNVSGQPGSGYLPGGRVERQRNYDPNYYGYEYGPNSSSGRRANVGASGDMVFGMYNLRQR